MRQFERRRLEAHVATGRRAEHESEVDVDEVPIRVEQNVAVVSKTVKLIKSTPTCGIPRRTNLSLTCKR